MILKFPSTDRVLVAYPVKETGDGFTFKIPMHKINYLEREDLYDYGGYMIVADDIYEVTVPFDSVLLPPNTEV